MREDSQAPLAVLNQAIDVLHRFREKNAEMTITNALAFLYVARDNGKIIQRELLKKLNVPDATISRMIRALTKEGDGRSPGLGLVELHPDPADIRRKLIVLTPDGKQLRKKLLEAFAKPARSGAM
jgi:DNA-binding MarR family transcriptional regulator